MAVHSGPDACPRSRQYHRGRWGCSLCRLRSAARDSGARAPEHPGAGRRRTPRRDRHDDRAPAPARSSSASTRRSRRRSRTPSSPSIGFGASFQLLRLGGPLVLRFFLFATAVAVLQNVIGAAVAAALGQAAAARCVGRFRDLDGRSRDRPGFRAALRAGGRSGRRDRCRGRRHGGHRVRRPHWRAARDVPHRTRPPGPSTRLRSFAESRADCWGAGRPHRSRNAHRRVARPGTALGGAVR